MRVCGILVLTIVLIACPCFVCAEVECRHYGQSYDPSEKQTTNPQRYSSYETFSLGIFTYTLANNMMCWLGKMNIYSYEISLCLNFIWFHTGYRAQNEVRWIPHCDSWKEKSTNKHNGHNLSIFHDLFTSLSIANECVYISRQIFMYLMKRCVWKQNGVILHAINSLRPSDAYMRQ